MSFWWHPYRLMEIVSLLCTADEHRLEELRACGKLAVTYADILEIGGPVRLESAFCEFNHFAFLQTLCAHLSAHADEPARAAIEKAFHKAQALASEQGAMIGA
jgi:hypothetical protein